MHFFYLCTIEEFEKNNISECSIFSALYARLRSIKLNSMMPWYGVFCTVLFCYIYCGEVSQDGIRVQGTRCTVQ
jgi:hypothetical protein